MGERRLERDQPVEEVLLLVLEADVEDVGLTAGRDVAGHLESHRRLAGTLGPADEQELADAQPGPHRLVQGGEPERHRLVLADPAAGDAFVEIDQDVQGRARRHAAGGGIEPPRPLRDGRGIRVGCLGAHER
jgi:hypothetical protein